MQQLEELLKLLQGIPPFAQLAHDKLISLAVFLQPVTIAKDSVIAREGDAVSTLYIIQRGTAAQGSDGYSQPARYQSAVVGLSCLLHAGATGRTQDGPALLMLCSVRKTHACVILHARLKACMWRGCNHAARNFTHTGRRMCHILALSQRSLL